MRCGVKVTFAFTTALLATSVHAHSFGKTFTLPMPFWMYAWASSAVLILTFLVLIVQTNNATSTTQTKVPEPQSVPRLKADFKIKLGHLFGTAVWVIAIASGWWGTQNRDANLNMTLFWVILLLGLVYLSGLLGNLYSRINPMLLPAQAGEHLAKLLGRRPPADWPSAIRHWPSFLGFVALIWIELFSVNTPKLLAWSMLIYLLYCFASGIAFGARNTLCYGDTLGLYFRLISRCAQHLARVIPIREQSCKQSDLQQPADNWAMVLFLLGLVSFTALDGLRDTEYWFKTVWPAFVEILSPFLSSSTSSVAGNPLLAMAVMGPWFARFEQLLLLTSPILLGILLSTALAAGQLLTGRKQSLSHLVLAYAPALIPIALAYSFSHYFTLMLSQGVQIVHLLSDPLGQGWNLFGTRNWWRAPIMIEAQTIWNIQLMSILIGHMASAWVAHQQAFRLYTSRRDANLSQLPMLLLMIVLTLLGLWILSQPVQIG